MTFHILGNSSIPTDELRFFRGVAVLWINMPCSKILVIHLPANIWLWNAMDQHEYNFQEHPFTSYTGVHQRYKVLTHHMFRMGESLEENGSASG